MSDPLDDWLTAKIGKVVADHPGMKVQGQKAAAAVQKHGADLDRWAHRNTPPEAYLIRDAQNWAEQKLAPIGPMVARAVPATPVATMKEVTVEGDSPVAKPEPVQGLANLRRGPIEIPQAHNKPMTHEQLVAKAQRMQSEMQAQKEAQMGAGPAVGEVDRDANGMVLPSWLKGAAGR